MLKGYDEQHKFVLGHLEEKMYAGSRIKNVWVYNFESELEKISLLLEDYPFIAFVSSLSLFIEMTGH
jgi:hypothetical protein